MRVVEKMRRAVDPAGSLGDDSISTIEVRPIMDYQMPESQKGGR